MKLNRGGHYYTFMILKACIQMVLTFLYIVNIVEGMKDY